MDNARGDAEGSFTPFPAIDTEHIVERFQDRVLAELVSRGLITDEVPTQILSQEHSRFGAWVGEPFTEENRTKFVARYIERGPLSLEKLTIEDDIVSYATHDGRTPLGALIVTDYAIGLDNTGLFYEVSPPDYKSVELERRATAAIETAVRKESRFSGVIRPYVSRADVVLTEKLLARAQQSEIPVRKGVTVSNSGFFANQGRHISSVVPTVPDIDAVFAELDTGIPDLKVENMEMEASFLLHFLAGIGARGGAICVGIANRRQDSFASGWRDSVHVATEVAIETLAELRR